MTRPVVPDYYDVLGVGRDADTDAITRAYRRLARKVHPDTGGTNGLFVLLRSAYETLSDPRERRAYDEDARHPATGDETPPWQDDDTWQDEEDTWQDEEDTWQDQGAWQDGPAYDSAFDPAMVSWWDDVDPAVEPMVAPYYGTGNRSVVFTLVLFLAASGVMIATWLPAAALAVCGVLLVCLSYRRGAALAHHTGLSTLAVLGVLLAAGAHGWYGPWLLGPLLAALAVLLAIIAAARAGRRGKIQALDQWIPYDYVEGREHGEPDASCGPELDALAALSRVPGTQLFHRLPVPGSEEQVVDHAITCGSKVALVECRRSEPGSYRWSADGTLTVDGRPVDVHIKTTVARYAELLSYNVTVRGYIMVVPTSSGRVVEAIGGEVRCGDPLTMTDRIGEWFMTPEAPDYGSAELVKRDVLLDLRCIDEVGEPWKWARWCIQEPAP